MRTASKRSTSILFTAPIIPLLILFCFLTGMVGCKDDKDDGVKPDKFLTASVAGSAFTATAISSKITGNALSVEGIGSNGTLIQINLNLTNTQQGETYSVGLHQNGWYKDSSGTFFFDDGTITITEFSDSQVEGTFTVEGEDIDDVRITIQQGKFRSSYTK